MSAAGRSLVLLTEGDARRGMGHLTRCRGYAQAWRELGGRVSWVVDGDALAATALADETEIEWRSWQAGATGVDADVLVADSYSADAATLSALAQGVTTAAFIDDLFRDVFPFGSLVVHSAPGPLPPLPRPDDWLSGPRWHPMRAAFWDVAERQGAPAAIRSVLVLAGGIDSRGVAGAMIAAVQRALPQAIINLVVGAGDPPDDLPDVVRVHRGLGAEGMRDLMLASDLAVTAAGQTIYELARCGCPSVLVGIADNQRRHMTHWPDTGAGVAAGWWSDVDLSSRIAAAVAALSRERRQTMSKAGSALVDGQGCRRLVAQLEARL